MDQNIAKGSGFLKVTGILMIIGGSLSIILSLISFAGVAALSYLAEVSMGMLYAACALSLVCAVVELIAGIVGVKNCKNPEKAGICIVWGVLVAVLYIISTILSSVGGGEFNIVSLLIGLVLPVLYIIGAFKNKNA